MPLHFQRGLDEHPEIHQLAFELDASSGDARNVEQVVEQVARDAGSDSESALARARPEASAPPHPTGWRRASARALTMTPTGFRNSCASIARNSSLARLAASAWARATRSRNSNPSRSRCRRFCSRNVARHRGRADDSAVSIRDRRHREHDQDSLSVLGDSLRFEV
jgi:hypothetical protein